MQVVWTSQRALENQVMALHIPPTTEGFGPLNTAA